MKIITMTCKQAWPVTASFVSVDARRCTRSASALTIVSWCEQYVALKPISSTQVICEKRSGMFRSASLNISLPARGAGVKTHRMGVNGGETREAHRAW